VISLPFPFIVFARNTVGFCFFLPFFLLKRKQLKTKRFPFHCLRTCLSLAAAYCSVYGIQHLNLGDAILLEQTAPLFVLAISFFWKGEKLSQPSLIAILIAFLGVGCISKPRFDFWDVNVIASLFAGFLIALTYISRESLSRTDSSLCILFYFLWISSFLSIGPAIGHWVEVTSIQQVMLLLAIGIFFAAFQYLFNKALMFISANVLGSYTYLVTVFSLILGYFFLSEELSLSRLSGCLCIIGAGIYIFYEKRKKTARNENDENTSSPR
jgi:drug/metabolite transporter (DMT)-like permease